ncbi:hypothetical protein GWN90_23265 [candidate division KSB1 bacterium]|nr:hypothetical protein [candidate division KSB1 bacterium]
MLLIIVLGAMLQTGCTSHKNGAPKERKAVQHKIYFESIESEKTVSEQETVEVTVKGNLPSPAYSLEGFDVNVKNELIEITPIVKHDSSKMVAQVLVPFEEVCRVGKLEPGNYQIQIMGPQEEVEVQKSLKVSK